MGERDGISPIGADEMAKQKLAYINDSDVWEFICNLNNFSQWVRDQARREMQGGIDPAIVDYINRMMGGRVVEPVVISVGEFDVESSVVL